MNTITGTVEKIYRDMRKTKFGEKESTTFVIDGVKYGGGFKKYSVKEGDTVTVSYDPGQYNNINSLALASPGNVTPSHSKGPRKAGEEGGFPLHPLAYERALDRRNALMVAVQACVASGVTDANTIISMAKVFEAYTTGDVEREEAEAEFKAEKADPYNFS